MFIMWMRVGFVMIIDIRFFFLMNYKIVLYVNLIIIYWWCIDIVGDNIN